MDYYYKKLINCLDLSDKIGTHETFKKATKCSIEEAYLKFWNSEIEQPDIARLQFYKEVKNNYAPEEYLKLENFEQRRIIAKLRCSDQTLEIETGRHRKIVRTELFCKQCNAGVIETEAHFLLECNKYDIVRQKHNVAEYTTIQQFMNDWDQHKLGTYLGEAFSLRGIG